MEERFNVRITDDTNDSYNLKLTNDQIKMLDFIINEMRYNGISYERLSDDDFDVL